MSRVSDAFSITLPLNTFAIRSHAAALIYNSPIVERAVNGDLVPLIETFWPFVDEFPLIIANQLRVTRLVLILGPRFGWSTAVGKLLAMWRVTRLMASEEGDHSKLWAETAAKLGVIFPSSRSPSVTLLLTVLRNDRHLWRFLARLAATEYVAEELARRVPSLGKWSEAHLMVHDAPSHLEMDLDLACACHPGGVNAIDEITVAILSYMKLFAQAAI